MPLRGKLPYLDRIDQAQAAFGGHDLGGVQAHVGGAAVTASERIGAEAYASGEHVAFRGAPDLRRRSAPAVTEPAVIEHRRIAGRNAPGRGRSRSRLACRVAVDRTRKTYVILLAGNARNIRTYVSDSRGCLPMTDDARGYLIRQLETAWMLTSYHLDGLATDECLWRPAQAGLHVHRLADGTWRADWPEHEGYDLGPPSIAWLTWHLGFWWSMVIDHSFGDGTLSRENVSWPGDAGGVREWLGRLQEQWRAALERLTDDDLRSTQRTRWPFQDRPFGDVVAWANVELTKNAAEIGYARFLYAVRPR